jgi:hypothetical protein
MALALAAVACVGERATGPNHADGFDAARAGADARAMQNVLGAAALESFAVLSERFDLTSAPSAAVAASRDVLAAGDASSPLEAKRLAVAVAGRVLNGARGATPAARAIRPESLGKTFVYDPALRRYVVAPDRAGAPADGVRFILYAVNPVTRQPIVDREIGYADLHDEGAARASGIALRLVVVSEETTFLDYAVTVDGGSGSGALSIVGFLTDGVTRLNFRIDAHGAASAGSATLDVAFEFAIPERGFAASAHVQGATTEAGHVEHVDLVVHSGAATIAFDVVSDGQTVNATILVNGQLFATVTGDASHPDVRGAGGRPLTPDEVDALTQFMHIAGGVFELFGNLLKPVDAVLRMASSV